MEATPLLILTPHNSSYVPQDILWEMLGEASRDPEARQHHLDRLFTQSDPYTDVIFHVPGAQHVYAPLSRFVVDLNRERHEGGVNGVIKLTDFDAVPLYPEGFVLSRVAAEVRLARYWDAFHRDVTGILEESCVQLLIDGHAMSPLGPAIGPDTGAPRPALSLMTGGDAHGEPIAEVPQTVSAPAARALQEAASRHFRDVLRGVPGVPAEVALNDPWNVDEISLRYSQQRATRTPRLAAFGLEINRGLYLEPCGAREKPIAGRLHALQQAFAAFAEEALSVTQKHPLEAAI